MATRGDGRGGVRRGLLLLLALLAGTAEAEPRREDRGDLIVLHLEGSYEEMGRQQAALLEPELRAVYALQRGNFERGLAGAGLGAAILNRLLFPLWSGVGPLYEESGFNAEIHGIADGLGVARSDLLRAIFSLSAGSTVFAATRSATADGGALLGRNVDWDDGAGRRRPLVVLYHPTNGDLAHVFAGWPLVGVPTVGINEAGFALSFNFFLSEPRTGLLFPQWPHRRALQRARTVEEGIRIFQEVRLRGISTFMVMADASGDIAMLECLPAECAVFRPEGDWFAQANHARTEAMIPHDTYRSPDSFSRRAAMEDAVRARLGRLTPESAAAILRDRSNAAWPNAPSVANLAVLNAVVVHPASRTLWHATSMQPHAPFGAYVPFSPDRDGSEAPVLPADPWLGSEGQRREAAAIAEARSALAHHDAGRFAEAVAIWDRLALATPAILDPTRLAFVRALDRWQLGELETASALLEPATEDSGAGFEIRAEALVARARLADRLGRRDAALDLYRRAQAHLDAGPEFNVFGGLRERIAAGLAGPELDGPLPEIGFLLYVPR